MLKVVNVLHQKIHFNSLQTYTCVREGEESGMENVYVRTRVHMYVRVYVCACVHVCRNVHSFIRMHRHMYISTMHACVRMHAIL